MSEQPTAPAHQPAGRLEGCAAGARLRWLCGTTLLGEMARWPAGRVSPRRRCRSFGRPTTPLALPILCIVLRPRFGARPTMNTLLDQLDERHRCRLVTLQMPVAFGVQRAIIVAGRTRSDCLIGPIGG